MRVAGFILVIESYLLRKGMASLLNRIQGTRIIREFSEVEPFMEFMSRAGADFLIISESLLDESSDLYLSESGLLEKTLILKMGPPGEAGDAPGSVLYHTEDKDSLVRKITGLFEPDSTKNDFQRTGELTRREREIVRLVSLGLTNRQIAEELFLSTHTVITHRKNISSKLGIKSASGLTIYAIVNNIITIEEAASSHPG